MEPDLLDTLGRLKLFADLTPPQLEAVAHTFQELWFSEGQRILREGFAQPDFYVILHGDAAARAGGRDQARLSDGDFFGEISVLSGEPPSADIVALTSLHCVRLPGDQLLELLTMFPRLTYRMLQAEAEKLRRANLWRT